VSVLRGREGKAELGSLIGPRLSGAILAIEAGSLVAELGASVVEVPAPESEPFTLPAGQHDVAIVGGLGGATPLGLARALAPVVRSGGAVVFALPTTRHGLKGATGSLLGMLRRKKPVLFEELCEALLIAGLADIRARELADSSGTSIVWGAVR
jgi:hypothetical protein